MGHELAVWLFGPPASGKSTFLAGLQAMLGHRAGVLGLAEIERNRFALAGLPGKTLVAASEQPSSYLASTNVLNAIISGEPLQVERKYRDPVTVIPRRKIAWAMNELSRVADAN
jgi:putative DNA primase/helicase